MIKKKAPDVRREELLNAGLKCAVLFGFYTMRSQDVVDAAQVCRPLLHYYFKSMRTYRGELVKHAIKLQDMEVLAQIVFGHNQGLADMVPLALRLRAREYRLAPCEHSH